MELAKQYATGGPAVIAWGWGGPDKWYHADSLGRAGGILAAITGNIGRVGGGGRRCKSSYARLGRTAGQLADSASLHGCTGNAGYGFPQKPNSVRAVVIQGNALAQWFGNSNRTEAWIDKLDLVVVVDIFQNDSVNYADIVLPTCTNFESEYEVNNIQIRRNHIMLQQKVIPPLFESKSDFQIEKELAGKLGLGQYLPKDMRNSKTSVWRIRRRRSRESQSAR